MPIKDHHNPNLYLHLQNYLLQPLPDVLAKPPTLHLLLIKDHHNTRFTKVPSSTATGRACQAAHSTFHQNCLLSQELTS